MLTLTLTPPLSKLIMIMVPILGMTKPGPNYDHGQAPAITMLNTKLQPTTMSFHQLDIESNQLARAYQQIFDVGSNSAAPHPAGPPCMQ